MSAVLQETSAGITVLTLHNPERRNAFTAGMGRALSAAYRAADEDDAVRAIVVTGTPPAFCAGADMSAAGSTFDSPQDGFTASPIDPPAFALRTPVIAAVNGHAIGIGLTIAMQADIRILADDAKYAIPQVRRGMVPDAMAHWTVPHIAGTAVAADVLLTGRTFDGPEAARMGLANRSLPADEVLPAAMEIAADIAANVSPLSAALSKQLLWNTTRRGYGPERVADLETQAHLQVMGTDDAREGGASFVERRAPRFTSRVPRDWRGLD
ncbi:enoyl-CoA hydratase/isomerase family protein [Tomitella fengzijianii]|uniref:enoyl-CoA hydratase/isomerase family protein n=1 Tax=Tomitella fengzijianii TaxID=2597660 RepID=UPI00131C0FCB|nr:enoyl-CoA hydratase-related protein [Tomitella fengzijianii]